MKNEKGIGLLTLIITIIVMMFLVAVTIAIAVDGRFYDYTDEANTVNEQIQESNLVENTKGNIAVENVQ